RKKFSAVQFEHCGGLCARVLRAGNEILERKDVDPYQLLVEPEPPAALDHCFFSQQRAQAVQRRRERPMCAVALDIRPERGHERQHRSTGRSASDYCLEQIERAFRCLAWPFKCTAILRQGKSAKTAYSQSGSLRPGGGAWMPVSSSGQAA